MSKKKDLSEKYINSVFDKWLIETIKSKVAINKLQKAIEEIKKGNSDTVNKSDAYDNIVSKYIKIATSEDASYMDVSASKVIEILMDTVYKGVSFHISPVRMGRALSKAGARSRKIKGIAHYAIVKIRKKPKK